MLRWVMAGAREEILRRLGEELRTHRKYAGWLRVFDVLCAEGLTTVGRLADRLGKDYHGTYVQLSRFRRFVANYSRRLVRESAVAVELAVDNASDPPAVRLAVRPVVRKDQTLVLEDSDRAALRGIVAAFRRTVDGGGDRRLPAHEILALRECAAAAQDILDRVVWRNREAAPDAEPRALLQP